MRGIATALVTLAALVAASGAAASDPKDPQQRHTAADTKLARSIALRGSDFAKGWTLAPPGKPAPPCSAEPDESKLVQTARLDRTFVWTDKITTAGSEVDIFRTAAQARTDWRFSTLKLMRACLLEELRKAVGKSSRVTVASARALPAPKIGERSLHYRVVFELNGNAKRPLVTELVAVNVGRISVVLHSLSVGAPLPAAAVSSFTGLLAKRLADATSGI